MKRKPFLFVLINRIKVDRDRVISGKFDGICNLFFQKFQIFRGLEEVGKLVSQFHKQFVFQFFLLLTERTPDIDLLHSELLIDLSFDFFGLLFDLHGGTALCVSLMLFKGLLESIHIFVQHPVASGSGIFHTGIKKML